jgi:hypothetical protein
MDDLELLSDDHTLLGAQVIHVVALVKSRGEGHYETAALFAEIVRQTELLGSQLVEHFAFEEETAFPRLNHKYPAIGARLQILLTQHAEVLAAFNELRSAIRGEPELSSSQDTSAKSLFFESAFERHATEERELLRELAATPGQESDHN